MASYFGEMAVPQFGWARDRLHGRAAHAPGRFGQVWGRLEGALARRLEASGATDAMQPMRDPKRQGAVVVPLRAIGSSPDPASAQGKRRPSAARPAGAKASPDRTGPTQRAVGWPLAGRTCWQEGEKSRAGARDAARPSEPRAVTSKDHPPLGHSGQRPDDGATRRICWGAKAAGSSLAGLGGPKKPARLNPLVETGCGVAVSA